MMSYYATFMSVLTGEGEPATALSITEEVLPAMKRPLAEAVSPEQAEPCTSEQAELHCGGTHGGTL